MQAGEGASITATLQSAFADSVDYYGWPRAERQGELAAFAAAFLRSARGAVLPATRVAVAPGGALVGVLLVREGPSSGPVVDALGVVPAWRRRGVASALLSAALAALSSAGRVAVYSGSVLANHVSVAWHDVRGFEPLDDALVAAAYERHHAWEADRLAGIAPGASARHAREAARWRSVSAGLARGGGLVVAVDHLAPAARSAPEAGGA